MVEAIRKRVTYVVVSILFHALDFDAFCSYKVLFVLALLRGLLHIHSTRRTCEL